MTRIAFMNGLVLAAFLLASGVPAQESSKTPELTERGIRILDALEPTGETRDCIAVSRIRSAKVLGDGAILFEMRGRERWLNVLDDRCPMLSTHEQFTYNVSTGQLCSTEIVTVVIRGAGPGASCGLGTFSGYRDKPSEE